MANTSATGGYLSPAVVSPPLEDAELDAFLQAMVVGITGLDGTLVRPRWQPVTPKQPEPDVNWCAIGVLNITPDDNAAIIHHPENDGSDEMQRHEIVDLLASFYGPSAYANAAKMRDGLMIAQNREPLILAGMALVSADKITSLPDLVSQQWLRRADLPITIRRIVTRSYEVKNLLSAQGTITAAAGSVAGEAAITETFEASS